MNPPIQIELLKLANGTRLLRLSEPASGLSLEKRLDPSRSVLRQKHHWLRCFEALIEREFAAA